MTAASPWGKPLLPIPPPEELLPVSLSAPIHPNEAIPVRKELSLPTAARVVYRILHIIQRPYFQSESTQ
jgi:hypothetical protein